MFPLYKPPQHPSTAFLNPTPKGRESAALSSCFTLHGDCCFEQSLVQGPCSCIPRGILEGYCFSHQKSLNCLSK